MTPHQRPFPLAIQDTLRFLTSYRERLPMFIITDHPSDYPDFYVARLHLTLPAHEIMPFAIMDRHLEHLQGTMLALGLTKLATSPGDDPVILETWI